MALFKNQEDVIKNRENENGNAFDGSIANDMRQNKIIMIGKIIRNPKISVANPGIINRSAAMAIAAPEITS